MAFSLHRHRRAACITCAIALLILLAASACQAPAKHEPTGRSRPSAASPTAQTFLAAGPRRRGMSGNEAARTLLREKRVGRVSFTAATGSYADVIKLLRTVSGVPILLTPQARQVIEDEGLTLELDVVAPLSVANMLDLMASRSEQLDWTVRNGVVEFGSKAQAGGELVMVNHDVRDLVFARTEFLPPVIKGLPSGDTFGDASPRAGGESDEKVAAVEPDALLEMVKLATEPGYWEVEGGGTMEFLDGGYVLVMATEKMQRRVARVLSGLR